MLRVWLWTPLALSGEAPADGFTRVAGAVHVHTTLSDGGGDPQEVIAAARGAGLGFVVITDHNNLDAKAFEGYHDGLLVLVGTEISTDHGHLLGLGIPDPEFRFSGDARDALEDVRDLGGFSFAAHPLSPRPDFRWTGWSLPGPWGIELLNGDSQWREAGWGRLARTALLYRLRPSYALLGSLTSPSAALARWDELLAVRDAAGLAGSDAHSRMPLLKGRAMRFPSYESLFRLVQNHVLLPRRLAGEAGPDGRAVLEALARGHSYVGLDALAPAGDFSFTAEADGRIWTMGDTIAPETTLRLRAGGRLPPGARIVLLRDGRALREAADRLDAPSAGPGVYRVEVRVRGWEVPWIVSNPIYVFAPAQAEERARHAAWPPEGPPPDRRLALDSFDKGTILAPEFDSSSWMNPDVLVASAGPDGKGAGRLEFRLGSPAPGRPYTWCALVSRRALDLSGFRGLVFSLKADGVYRLWVQLRDENPASPDEGTEWWFRSVRTARDWRQVAVPFEAFRSISKHSDGRLDLDKIRQLVFVLDPGAVKPGTHGTIWLAEIAAY